MITNLKSTLDVVSLVSDFLTLLPALNHRQTPPAHTGGLSSVSGTLKTSGHSAVSSHVYLDKPSCTWAQILLQLQPVRTLRPTSGHSSHCPPTCPGERPPSILSALSSVLCWSLSPGSCPATFQLKCPATFQLKSLPTKAENVLSQGHSHLHCDHIQGQTRLLSGLSTQVPSPTCKVNIKTMNRRPKRTMSCWQWLL